MARRCANFAEASSAGSTPGRDASGEPPFFFFFFFFFFPALGGSFEARLPQRNNEVTNFSSSGPILLLYHKSPNHKVGTETEPTSASDFENLTGPQCLEYIRKL